MIDKYTHINLNTHDFEVVLENINLMLKDAYERDLKLHISGDIGFINKGNKKEYKLFLVLYDKDKHYPDC
jgi:hypothetical protein